MNKIPRSFGTHDGTFHADEVTACALLLLFNLIEEKNIVRTRDRDKLNQCEFVCDVGGVYDPHLKLFDHHQVEYKGSFSSAGMILNYLNQIEILQPNEYHYLNDSLIRGVDAHDNGKEKPIAGLCSYSHVVANFAPIPYDPPASVQDDAFLDAVHFALGHLQRLWNRLQYNQSFKDVISKAMQKNEQYLVFENAMPWLEMFFQLKGESHPALFVIMPSGHQWSLRGIPPSYEDRMNVRLPLPLEWAGLCGEELKHKCGIGGAVFCHKGRFYSVWETKEDAIKAMQSTLEKSHQECV